MYCLPVGAVSEGAGEKWSDKGIFLLPAGVLVQQSLGGFSGTSFCSPGSRTPVALLQFPQCRLLHPARLPLAQLLPFTQLLQHPALSTFCWHHQWVIW